MQAMEFRNLKDIISNVKTRDTIQWAIDSWFESNNITQINLAGNTAHTSAQGFPKYTYLGTHDSDIGMSATKYKCAVYLTAKGYLEVILDLDGPEGASNGPAPEEDLPGRKVPTYLVGMGNLLVPKYYEVRKSVNLTNQTKFVSDLTASGYLSAYTSTDPAANTWIKHIASYSMMQASWNTSRVTTLQETNFKHGAWNSYSGENEIQIMVDAWAYYIALKSGKMDDYIYKNIPQGKVLGNEWISDQTREPVVNWTGNFNVSGALGPILFRLTDGANDDIWEGSTLRSEAYSLYFNKVATAGFSSNVIEKLW